jgi:DNA-directed RNA polymerase specialized sigma subunit
VDRKEEDLKIWSVWKKNKSPSNATKLVNHFIPLVRTDIARYSSNMAPAVVEAHAKDLILQASDKYSRSEGVALATFIKSYMRKLSQRNSDWRSPLKIPAHRAYKYPIFKDGYEELANNKNREPTVSELSDHLKWSKAEVTRFLNEIRKEYTETKPFVASYIPQQSYEEEMLDYVYHDMTTPEKLLFELTSGYGGKPKRHSKEIMKIMNWNQNQLSYNKKKLVDKIQEVMKQ